MGKRLLVNAILAFLVLGLVFTVSCAKKSVVSDPDAVQTDTTDSDAQAKAAEEAERKRAIEEERLKEEALMEAEANKIAAAVRRFENIDIHFEYDSAVLSPMSQMLLKEKAAWLEEKGSVTVMIEGHCDERGTTEYNLALGERRAIAVQQFLLDIGIAGYRLNTISYGEERPLDTGGNPSSYAKNRRAHFVIE